MAERWFRWNGLRSMTPTPFVLNRPVQGATFFGRDDEMALVRARLQTHSAVNIFSQSRMGKTSFLAQIEYLCGWHDEWKQFHPIRWDAYVPGSILGLEGGFSHRDGFPSFSRLEPRIRQLCGDSGKRLLLLIDEGQMLAAQQDAASRFMFLRGLHQHGLASIVLSTLYGSLVDHLCANAVPASPFFTIFSYVELPSFKQPEAMDLITQLSRRGGAEISADVAGAIAHYVGGHPNLVQEMGNLAFERKKQGNDDSFDALRNQWLSTGQPWIALTSSMFRHQLQTYGKLPGIDPVVRLARSLESYGVLERGEGKMLTFAPYVRDLVKTDGPVDQKDLAKLLQTTLNAAQLAVADEVRKTLEPGLRYAFRDKAPTAEPEVQRIVDVCLAAAGFRFEREGPASLFSLKRFRPDHTLMSGELVLEVKLCRGPKDVARVVEEMSADLAPYLDRFKAVLFVVFDLGGIYDESQFCRDFEVNPRVRVLVIKR